MSSRLCHELASPVGAINNGIEMIEEFDDPMLPDALPLIGSSAKLVASRLTFYLMSYGSAGNHSIASFGDLMDLANAYFEEGRTSLSWPDIPIVPEMPDGAAKLLMNMQPLAAETLSRGGVLTVSLGNGAAALTMTVSAEGVSPRVSEECGQIIWKLPYPKHHSVF